jgi:hypothetical protein
VDLPGVGPPGRASYEIELAKEAADDLIRVLCGAEVVELLQDLSERPFDVMHSGLGKMLALLVKTLLALDEFLPVERAPERGLGLPDWKRVGEEAGDAMP